MIHFSRHILDNGLRVIIHEDPRSPLCGVNVLYNVGSKHEDPEKTGLAHLFEHLMFSGTENIPDFDVPLQLAGGDSNAFTNHDVTNFYNILPAQNLDTALWLESDRMKSVLFTDKNLKIQKGVVVEEFNETCFGEPFGDAWHHMGELAYKVHPYKWPTIGKKPEHVMKTNLGDIKDFFHRFYRPDNAILVVTGGIRTNEVMKKIKNWFGQIYKDSGVDHLLPHEPAQKKKEERLIESKVPADAIYLGFHMPGRTNKSFHTLDFISDILSNGRSSRMFQSLVKEKQIFANIDAYVSGSIDPGLFIIEGRLSEGRSIEEGKAAIKDQLRLLCNEKVNENEMTKLKNKFESTLVFSELNILSKAINLAFYELLGNAALVNRELDQYKLVDADMIIQEACKTFTEENTSELIYRSIS